MSEHLPNIVDLNYSIVQAWKRNVKLLREAGCFTIKQQLSVLAVAC